MIEIKELENPVQIEDQKEAYLRGLIFPMDAYWQAAVIGQGDHWQIEVDGQQAGYFVTGASKRLLQFFVTDPFLPLSSELFNQVISGDLVRCASAGTFEPIYLSHCLDQQLGVAVRSYLFQDYKQVEVVLDSYPAAEFRLATAVDVEKLAQFYAENDEFEDTEAIETSFGSRINYARSLIEQEQVFVLVDQNELIGIGECRISVSQPPYADLGIISGKKHRRQGIGTTILTRLKQFCYERGVKPICSCAIENVASRKTIEKSGFITQHRLLDFEFAENS